VIRRLTLADVPRAFELSAEAGWNQTREDWSRLLRLAPETCLGIGAPESTATAVIYGGELAWIGMVLTTAAARGQGNARRLMTRLIETAPVETLGLDATAAGQPIYEALGFVAEQPVERWLRPPGPAEAVELPGGLPDLDLDRAAFGADRAEILTGACHVDGHGFALGRPGRVATYFGPAVTTGDPMPLAKAFVAAHAGEPIFWDLFPANERAVRAAGELGFRPARKLMRMFRGRPVRQRVEWLAALAGFEFG